MTDGHDAPQPDPIPISLVAHTVFCPRRAWLEAAGERTDTDQMAAGVAAHRRVDDPTADRSGTYRQLDVQHTDLGLIGKCDVVHDESDSSVSIVEYKATPVKRRAEVTEAMRVQLTLQRLCLEDMGLRVTGQAIHFTGHHRTVAVPVEPDDHDIAVDYVHSTRRICTASVAPEPLEDDPRCANCSHVSVCLPDERRQEPVRRQIRVSDPDAQVVHLATQGSRASVRQGRLRVTQHDEELASVPLERVQGLVVHGNVDLSGALIREMCRRDLTIVWCVSNGRVTGWSRSAHSPNGLTRVRQHVASAEGRLQLAREFVGAKIANQATLLRRSLGVTAAVDSLRKSQHAAAHIETVGELFGIEGSAAATYFAAFPTMLDESKAGAFLARWPGRSGRGAVDPLNVALNYTYGILSGEAIRAVVACGLDPHAGFLHSSNRNKPALALDLMEEFRAPLADSIVIRAINNGELTAGAFHDILGSTRLTDSGRKKLIAAFEQRLGNTFRHPVFGYEVSWRRALEVQARMILGYLDGSQDRYRGIRIR